MDSSRTVYAHADVMELKMNTEILTKEYKNFLWFAAVTNIFNMITGALVLLGPELDLLFLIATSIGFVVLALNDARERVANGVTAVSGWWALLGIAYPIALSIKEKTWNSFLSYAVFGICVPVVISFVFVFIFGE